MKKQLELFPPIQGPQMLPGLSQLLKDLPLCMVELCHTKWAISEADFGGLVITAIDQRANDRPDYGDKFLETIAGCKPYHMHTTDEFCALVDAAAVMVQPPQKFFLAF